jgi:hypothetical protein
MNIMAFKKFAEGNLRVSIWQQGLSKLAMRLAMKFDITHNLYQACNSLSIYLDASKAF